MTKKVPFVLAVALLALVGLVAAPADTSLAQAGLRIGGRAANFGAFPLVGGFMPDPATRNIVSGGNIDASSLGLAPNCRGYVTAQPDVIVNYTNARSWVRFFVRAGGDTTLVINDASGRWWCSDDEGGSLNPMIDIANPPSGQYDVWIGSYRSGEQIRGTFAVTELSSQRP